MERRRALLAASGDGDDYPENYITVSSGLRTTFTFQYPTATDLTIVAISTLSGGSGTVLAPDGNYYAKTYIDVPAGTETLTVRGVGQFGQDTIVEISPNPDGTYKYTW